MSKIAIRYGAIGVEYEGSDEFIKDGLIDLLNDVAELAKTAPASLPKDTGAGGTPPSSALNVSVKTISMKIGNSKGSDLGRAAATFLTLVQKRETFTQGELLDAMKTATGIYKSTTHSKNMGTIVSSLIGSGFLIESSTGTYSVAEAQREQMSALLSGT